MFKVKCCSLLFLAVGLVTHSQAFAASGVKIANNTPKFTSTAKKLGPVDPSTVIEVSVWLNPHNKPELDSLAKELYTRSSSSYRHWLTKSELLSKFAPTTAEAKTVQEFFTANSLSLVKVGPDNFYVRAKGTVAAVSKAFQVTLNNYQVNGKTIRANAADPYVTGAAGPLVASVYGLDDSAFSHPNLKATPLPTKPSLPPGVQAASAGVAPSSSSPFDVPCFTGTRTETFTTNGSLPTATYTGNGYTKSPYGCGYYPAEIHTAYNLNALYAEGLDGTGQTIVIIDWCGSPTITTDANAFSSQFGLPALTSANFSIINTAPSYCSSPDPEINIDVEWAHAIAPGASIDLVVPPSATFQDTDEAWFYAVDYQLGNVISGSYASEELYTPDTVLITEDLIAEISSVLGISSNFSSGDYGDYTFGDPIDNTATISAPADSPYATAIGGVSLNLTASHKIDWQAGWGTNVGYLADEGPFDPPFSFYNFGSGGGSSAFFAKPYYQSALSGSTRLIPDISWLGDPYTGAFIAISVPFQVPELTYQVYGGTSLACPMFSALFAIANQAAGVPLGQAAPYLYSMPAGTITDIVQHGSAKNVVGTVTDASGSTYYSAATLATPGATTNYMSALWDYPLEPGFTLLLTFGTDGDLTVTPGWDFVTGLGVPNGKAFADYFK